MQFCLKSGSASPAARTKSVQGILEFAACRKMCINDSGDDLSAAGQETPEDVGNLLAVALDLHTRALRCAAASMEHQPWCCAFLNRMTLKQLKSEDLMLAYLGICTIER